MWSSLVLANLGMGVDEERWQRPSLEVECLGVPEE